MRHKDKIKYFFRKHGVSLKLGDNSRPLDLTGVAEIDPVGLSYLSEGRSYFAKIPIDKIIHLEHLSFGLSKSDASPFVHTLIEYNSGNTTYKGSVLEKYYELCQPTSVSNFMGIDNPENKTIEELPAPYAPRIFSTDSLDKTYMNCINRTLMENRRETGLKMPLEKGRSLYGPTNAEKGQVEFLRLTRTIESIKKNGYKFDKTGVDAISGVFLIDEVSNKWVFSVNSGQHRVACLAVLGYSHVIAHVIPKGRQGVLELGKSKHFPIVNLGILTTEEAEGILKRKIKKLQPNCAKPWVEFITGHNTDN